MNQLSIQPRDRTGSQVAFVDPSRSISEAFDQIQDAIAQAQMWSPGGMGSGVVAPSLTAASLEERLFNARAACKLKTAAVAMHLDRVWRDRFFMQVDSLLDSDEWDPADEPVTEASFTTLIRMLLHLHPVRRPGLGATADGHMIAAWTKDRDRLTIECLPGDEIRWVVARDCEGKRESAAGLTTLSRLVSVLAPYDPQRWFVNDDKKPPC